MTVDKIIPCICTFPNKNEADFVPDDGMPRLVVRNGIMRHRQFYSAYCPNCGRGSKQDDYKSSYLALKHWNEFQGRLWEFEEKGSSALFT